MWLSRRRSTLPESSPLGSFHEFLTLLNGIFDGADVEECLLWQVVNVTVENHVEALDGVLDADR